MARWKHAPQSRDLIATLLILTGLLAFHIRFEYQVIYGGAEDDYCAWATDFYFGKLTRLYVAQKDDLLGREGTRHPYQPGYSLFLAILDLAGLRDLDSVRLLQLLLDACAILAVYLLALRLGLAPPWGLTGAFLYAIYPRWAAGCGFLLAEFMAPMLMLWTLLLLLHQLARPRPWGFALLGFMVGLAAMFRPDWLLLVGPLALITYLALSGRARWLALAALLLGYALPIGAWGLQNRLRHDVWLFRSSNGGITLWEGLGELPNDYGYVCSDTYVKGYLAARGLTWMSPEADEHLKNAYLEAWIEHPGHVLKTIAYRWRNIAIAREWLGHQAFIDIERIATILGLPVLLLAAILARRRDLIVLLLPLGYALMSIGLVHYEARYVRYAHLSYLFAALTLLARFDSWLYARRPRIGRALRVLALALLAAFFIHELSRLHSARRRSEQETTLTRLHDRGALTLKADLLQLPWERRSSTATLQADASDLLLTTDARANGYQIAWPLPGKGQESLVVSYDLTIEGGAIALGILDGTTRWLGSHSLSTAAEKRHRGRLLFVAGQSATPILMIANASTGAPARLRIRELRVLGAENGDR